MNFVGLNISIGFMIITTMIIRKVALHRFPQGMFLYLWLIAGIRLLVPFLISSKYSFLTFCIYMKSQLAEEFYFFRVASNFRNQQFFNFLNAIYLFKKYFFLLWMLGCIILGFHFIRLFYQTPKELQKLVEYKPDEWINQQILRQIPWRSIKIKISKNLNTPASYGVLHPIILFPEHFVIKNTEELQFIIIHECCHIKYYHILWKMLATIMICICWFNPLSWVVFFYLERDLEIFCDKYVLKTLGQQQKKPYAMSLVKMAKLQKRDSFIYNHYINFSITERIDAIMNFKKVSLFACTVALAIPMGLATVFATTSNILADSQLREAVIIDVRESENPKQEKSIAVVLTMEEIAPYLENTQRAASSLSVNKYKYSTYGKIPPKTIDVSVKDGGYTYRGTLTLGDYGYESSTDKYTGFYSGTLYR